MSIAVAERAENGRGDGSGQKISGEDPPSRGRVEIKRATQLGQRGNEQGLHEREAQHRDGERPDDRPRVGDGFGGVRVLGRLVRGHILPYFIRNGMFRSELQYHGAILLS